MANVRYCRGMEGASQRPCHTRLAATTASVHTCSLNLSWVQPKRGVARKPMAYLRRMLQKRTVGRVDLGVTCMMGNVVIKAELSAPYLAGVNTRKWL
jgi:hypothetical protein